MERSAAIIVAGGRGRRYGGSLPKTLVDLDGETILGRAVAAFLPHMDELVVVAPEGFEDRVERICRALAAEPPAGGSATAGPAGAGSTARVSTHDALTVVTGGARRQDSVAAGLRATGEGVTNVLVHDGARPLVRARTIRAVLEAVHAHGAAIPVIPVHSTVKRVDDAGVVECTLPRDRLRLAQTPQGARRALLVRAVEEAAARDAEMTDEAALLEACGIPVVTVPGDETNVKITTPEDLVRAAAILRSRRAEGGPA